jgi:hypothetical protein
MWPSRRNTLGPLSRGSPEPVFPVLIVVATRSSRLCAFLKLRDLSLLCPCVSTWSLGQLLKYSSARQIYPAKAIDLGHLDHYLIANLAHVFNAWSRILSQLAEVYQPFLAGEDFNKGAETC